MLRDIDHNPEQPHRTPILNNDCDQITDPDNPAISSDHSVFEIMVLMLFRNQFAIGFGLFQLANNQTLFLSAPDYRAAAAGGIQGTARLSGQTAGTVIASLVFASIPRSIAPEVGFVIGSGFALAAALVSSLGIRKGHKVTANDMP